VGSFDSETSDTDVELPGLVNDAISAQEASEKINIKTKKVRKKDI
jgi:hypothetical protein